MAYYITRLFLVDSGASEELRSHSGATFRYCEIAIILSELGLLAPERYLESTEGLIPVALAISADLQRFSCIACLNFSLKSSTAFINCNYVIKWDIIADA